MKYLLLSIFLSFSGAFADTDDAMVIRCSTQTSGKSGRGININLYRNQAGEHYLKKSTYSFKYFCTRSCNIQTSNHVEIGRIHIPIESIDLTRWPFTVNFSGEDEAIRIFAQGQNSIVIIKSNLNPKMDFMSGEGISCYGV